MLSELDNAVSGSRQQSSEPVITVQDGPPPNKASSATKELDDLMASLSDFKVNVQTVGPTQSVKHSDDYAKPQRATSSGQQGSFFLITQYNAIKLFVIMHYFSSRRPAY